MKFRPIITSLLETDLYKFSMGQAIFHQASEYETTWSFKCRNKDVQFSSEMVAEIGEQIQAFCELHFTEDELQYLSHIKWLKKSYINHLRRWTPNFKDFMIKEGGDCGLILEASGTWLDTSMYEIPVLAIVNEVFFRFRDDYDALLESAKERTRAKADLLRSGVYWLPVFSEFGLRRRLCSAAQEYAIEQFSSLDTNDILRSYFVGTSNVFLAQKYGVKPVGTMAHEWIMAMGQGNHLYNPAYSNKVALDAWVKEYGVDNGIALTDTITTDCFLRDFDKTLATLFSGVRHDSGDPFIWGDKMIDHYTRLGIDPATKTLLFSDSLNFEKADKIARYFQGKAKVAFGIGTYLSNDTYAEPLNIVMKVTKCNGQDVAKISDAPGKGMCKSQEYVDYLQRAIDWRLKHNN
ncbi:nicotinate phosphoribosyltransferase [Selenomonas ruminantium]|jgi:nicotinate phosphoribosyltransferase|uniref:Nicotinate phosphoribosyltransferase n=1 Tax=Selenomonas ruminantium TaxID=971 RepID=A0A1K1LXC0_SELRU|nr:nicotinate phosphoribosyltransferase [Selenomonas ruminantium]SFW15490.1 nicotinate phosphoribosyltransferase [Selenomonas ruminantium]